MPTATLVVAASLALAPSAAAPATVRIPYPRDPGTLTPLTFTLGYPLLTLVYDTVTWRDAHGIPQPWLARSIETMDGGRRVLVRLRSGLRWHDGRALTARDVAFTYDFMRARRHPRFTPQLGAIARVRAIDRRTVEFVLRHPALGFADQPLADVPILPEHLWRGLRPGLRAPPGPPVGSGPYRVDARRADGGLRLTAVHDYFRGRPRADTVDVTIEPDASAMLALLRRGDADALPLPLTPAQAGSLEPISVRVARGPLYLGTMLMFNTRKAPFQRASVRRAIGEALDRERIAKAAGASVPATTGFLRPGSRWAPAPAPLRVPEAGRPLAGLNLPELRVLAPANDPTRLETGRQVVLALARAGARATLVRLSRARLGRAVGEGGGPASYDLAVWGLPALASYDPDFLASVFASRGRLNRSGYASAAYDQLSARVAAAPSVGARRAALTALQQRLASDAPAVSLTFGEGAFAYRSSSPVGWSFVAGTGIIDKRSLLRAAPEGATADATATPDGDDGGGGIGLFGALAAGMLALAVLLAGGAALARRR